MSKQQYLLIILAIAPSLVCAQEGIHLMDTRTFVHLMVDEFEVADVGDENDFSWDIDLSVGGDLKKFWMKTQGERSDAGDDHSELQLLYSKAVHPFWNLQTGVMRELEPAAERNWAVIGLQGLAPYFFEVEAELFFAEGGQSSFRVRGEYELLLTQRLFLTPELEIVGYGHAEPGRMIGSGLSRIEFDLRLRYELKRELAPYIGLSWQRFSGGTADLANISGRDRSDTMLSIGLRAWF